MASVGVAHTGCADALPAPSSTVSEAPARAPRWIQAPNRFFSFIMVSSVISNGSVAEDSLSTSRADHAVPRGALGRSLAEGSELWTGSPQRGLGVDGAF